MEQRKDYFQSKKFKEILNRFESSLTEAHSEYFGSDELSDIAEYYYNTGKLEKAIDVLDYGIKLHPGATMPLVFKGRIALIDYNNPALAQQYADAISDQLDLDCIYLQAEIKIAYGKVEDANSYLKEMMGKIDEDEIPDYLLDVATLFIDYKFPDIANEWLELSDEEDLPDYRELKARIAFTKGDYAQSEQIFEQLLDEDPYSQNYWNSLAVTQFMSNRINDSITSSEFSIAIDPNDDEAILNKANGLFSLGNFKEALTYYNRFLKLCPDEGAAYMFVGNCLLNMGHPEQALPQYDKALECYKRFEINTIEVNQCRAFAFSQLGQLNKAIECLDEANNSPNCNHSELSVIRGHILLEHNRIKEAIKNFVEALQSSHFSHEIFFRISISVYDCGYPAIAYRMFKTYYNVHHAPGDEGVAYLASCCRQLQKYDEYLKYLNIAAKQNPYETRKVLGEYFPEGMDPSDYFDYELHNNDKE